MHPVGFLRATTPRQQTNASLHHARRMPNSRTRLYCPSTCDRAYGLRKYMTSAVCKYEMSGAGRNIARRRR